ncbi:MAG: sugar transferase [Acidobacteriota bacterium]
MLKYYRHQFNSVCVLADLLAVLFSFLLAFWARRDLIPRLSTILASRPMFGFNDYVPVFLLASLVIMGTLFSAGGYRQNPGVSLTLTFASNVKAAAVALLLMLALAYLLKLTFMSRLFLAFFVGLFVIHSTLLKYLVALWFRRRAVAGKNCRLVVLVGTGEKAQKVARRLLEKPEIGVCPRGFMTLGQEDEREGAIALEALGVANLGSVQALPQFLAREVVDGVIFCVDTQDLAELEELFLICEDLGLDTLVAANLFPHLSAAVQMERLEELPLLRYTTVPHDQLALFLKRSLDVCVSALGLLLLAPILGLVAIAIKATSPGTIFFVQERMGLNGRRFKCFKFRTMVQGAENLKDHLEHMNEVDGPVFKIRQDPRVTPVGRLLRKSSLDELPQLWNVLKGDMSLVGPRPPIPSEVEKYQRWQRRRLSMRPGITCLWQISGRSDLDFDTWMRLDLQYIDHWSLMLDFVILLKTVPAVLSARGAA